MTNIQTRRGFLAAGVALLAGCATSPSPITTCALEIPADWSGVVLAREAQVEAAAVQGRVAPEGPAIRRETRFNVLSLGKMMTGVLIGQLVDEGRLRYRDPVGRHLSALPARIGNLPVRTLLNHTSGLGNYIEAEHFDDIREASSAHELLPFVLASRHAEPGPIEYSNSGYAIAGALIEALCGSTYAEMVRSRIFAACGMHSASLEFRSGDAVSAAAALAHRAGSRPAPCRPGPQAAPS